MKRKEFIFLLLILSPKIYACGDNEYEACYSFCAIPTFGGCALEAKDCKCLPKAPIPIPKPEDTFNETLKGLKNISKESAIAVNNLATNLEKAAEDIGKNISKSNEDFKAEISRAGKDTEEASSAIGHYMERMGQSIPPAIEQASIRAREGKVIDAIWHLGLSPYQENSKNSALAVTESSLLNSVAQVAATAYGGPEGAAAYAAWLTYEQTGNAELAVKVGILAGASNYAISQAGTMPSTTEYQMIKKVVVTGAIGGTAVAAAGGNEAAVKEAFLKAGSMVVIQDTFKNMTSHQLSGKASEGEPYCVTSFNSECAPPPDSYVRNSDGSLALDNRGIPKLDIAKLDPKRPMVGLKDPSAVFNESNIAMKAVSKIPGMNGMAVFHDQWTMKWDMNSFTTPSSIVPAVVLTYWGLGAPYYTGLQKTAVETKQQDMAFLNKMINQPVTKIKDEKDTGKTAVAYGDKKGNPLMPLEVKNNDIVQSYFCNKAETVRLIVVERPIENDRGFACRVVYSNENSEQVPWIAKNDGNFCKLKAKLLVKKQEGKGFLCKQSAMNREK